MFRFDCVHITERLPELGDGSDTSAGKGLYPYLLSKHCTLSALTGLKLVFRAPSEICAHCALPVPGVVPQRAMRIRVHSFLLTH